MIRARNNIAFPATSYLVKLRTFDVITNLAMYMLGICNDSQFCFAYCWVKFTL